MKMMMVEEKKKVVEEKEYGIGKKSLGKPVGIEKKSLKAHAD